MSISLECAVDSELNGVINYVVSYSVIELFIHKNHINSAFNGPKALQNILTTLHAMTKLFVPFCSAQDGEFTDMNCLVLWAHCENGEI